jgi:hypothetical protein
MAGFVKLFSSIVTSTVWCEDNATLRVWIAMLATSDAKGIVEGSVPGFANLARVTVDEMRHAIDVLSSPDKDSRTPDNEGRRISAVTGGWHILNYDKYRERTQDKEGSKAPFMRKLRANKREESNALPKEVTESNALPLPVTCYPEVEVEVEVEVRSKNKDQDQDQNPLSTSTQSVSADRDRSTEVLEVFEHYRECGHPTAHPKPKSTSKEWKAIRSRIADGYTVDDLKKAIDGMHMTPHNLGENERGQLYLGLELCMRTEGQVERFRETSEHGPPARKQILSKQDQSFMNALQHAEKFNAEVRARNTDMVHKEGAGAVLDVPGGTDADDHHPGVVVEARRLAP